MVLADKLGKVIGRFQKLSQRYIYKLKYSKSFMAHINKISKVEKLALAAGFAGAIALDKKGYRTAANVIISGELLYCAYNMVKPLAEEYFYVNEETPDC